ncbi:hypothetical protein [Pyruvatibacter mobilis]|uniref:deoxynucleotide monophosphate kinase family protein n=1 Tax=Pyruvatibacter mobilis TaxID=1712261 RepID=UPI003BAD63DF
MKDTPKLIALYAPAQSGKSEVAKVLRDDFGYTLVKFAGPLKAMVRTLLTEAGIPRWRHARYIEGDLKEAVIPELGSSISSRQLMQTLGTEWGRDALSDNFWVELALARIEAQHRAGMSVVIDDMRFPNELEMVHEMGGECWRIIRPGHEVPTGHASEGALDGYDHWDRVILNDDTLETLRIRSNPTKL